MSLRAQIGGVLSSGGGLSPADALYAWMAINSTNALWVDFLNYSTTFQDTAKTTPAGLGDPVRAVANLGPLAFDMTCNADAARPVLAAGGAQADGTNDFLSNTAVDIDAGAPSRTIIVRVAACSNTVNNPLVSFDGGTSQPSGLSVMDLTGGTHRMLGRDQNESLGSRVSEDFATTALPVTARYDGNGTVFNLYKDGAKGTQPVNTMAAAGSGGEGYALFARLDGAVSYVAATITEVIILPGVYLTGNAEGLALVNAYWQSKYGTNA
jgi:hypothetical protein